MNKEKEINEIEVVEDVSRNGEFIPTKFAWISLGYQKENAKRLQNITKKEDKLKFNYENAWRIVQIASISGGAKILADNKRKKIQNRFFSIVTPKKKMYFIKGDYDFNIDKPRI